MVRITIDEELKHKLLSAGDFVELCDASGTVLARFTPQPSEPIDWRASFPELTPEEIDRRCSDTRPGLTTEQVKQRLRALDES